MKRQKKKPTKQGKINDLPAPRQVKREEDRTIYDATHLEGIGEPRLVGRLPNRELSRSTNQRLERIAVSYPDYLIEGMYSFLEEAVQDSPNLQRLLLPYLSVQEFISKSQYSWIGDDFLKFENIDTLMKEIRNLSGEITNQLRRKNLLEQLFHELEKLNVSGILTPARMKKLGEAIQRIPVPGEVTPAMKLHQRLESAGAYERLKQLDARRATLLQTYLTTEKSALDAGKEVGIGSRSRATELLHTSMEVAFFALPEDERAAYDNNPAKALQTRSKQQTQTKSERLKQAADKRKSPETGRIEFSSTHKEHLTEGNLRRWQRQREMQQLDANGNTPN